MPNVLPSARGRFARRALRRAAAVLVLLLGAGAALAGGSASSSFQVSVALQSYVKFHVLSRPGAVEVSQADIERGYLDVATPVQLALETDLKHGFTLLVTCMGEFVRGARVRGLGPEAELPAQGELSWRPRAGSETVQLHFRLQLARDAAPGRYPWPIQLTLSAI